MKIRFRIPDLLFYVLTLLVIIISIICFAKALSWVNKPFAGFMLYEMPYVGTYSDRDWPGPKAGLRTLDRIVRVDGQIVLNSNDVIKEVRSKEPGSSVHYVVESKGNTIEFTLPAINFTIKDFILIFFTTFLGGLLLYGLGCIVYLLKPNVSSSWVFLGLCASLGVYMITGFEILSTYLFSHIHVLVLPLFPAFFFHLGLIFPNRKHIIARWPWFEYIIYLPALIIALFFQIYYFSFDEILNLNSMHWMFSFKELTVMARIFTLFGVLSLIFFIIHDAYRTSTIIARKRARMMLFGVGVAFVPTGISQALVTIANINIPWNFLVFIIIFFPASIAYSITKHNLFEADAIIRRTVGYAVVTAVVVGAYVGVSLVLNVFIGQSQLAQSRVFPILFTLAVILVFNPLRDHIQALVDRLFFRKEYDYGEIVEKVSGAMTTLLDLPQILNRLVQTFTDDMFIDTSSVMLLTPDGTQYKVFLADGEKKQDVEGRAIKRIDPLFEIIEKEKKELTKYDVLEDPKYIDVSESSVSDFEALRASLIIPLVYQDQVIGSMNLGEKKSGKPFNREDIDLLRTLAHQGAVAIENAHAFPGKPGKAAHGRRAQHRAGSSDEHAAGCLPGD